MVEVSWRSSFWLTDTAIFLHTYTVMRGRASSFLLLRALIPSWELHSHELITSQWPYPLVPSYWGLGFNIWIWGAQICSPYTTEHATSVRVNQRTPSLLVSARVCSSLCMCLWVHVWCACMQAYVHFEGTVFHYRGPWWIIRSLAAKFFFLIN